MANPPSNRVQAIFEVAFGRNNRRSGGRNGDADLEPFLFRVPIDRTTLSLHDAFALALANNDGRILFLFEHRNRAIVGDLELSSYGLFLRQSVLDGRDVDITFFN